jgi:2-furoyl-CoA dehydrogenase large subunit
VLAAPPQDVWRCLVDARELAAIVPGCQDLRQDGPDSYSARVVIGVAGIRGTYDARIELRDQQEGKSVRLIGKASGALGFGSGSGWVTLAPEGDGTRLTYRYAADVGGKVAAVGQRMLGTVTRVLIAQFFRALERRFAPRGDQRSANWLSRLLPWRRRQP